MPEVGHIKRIGILGGTFDPLHNGHIAIATSALDALDLDEVLLVPAAVPPFKEDCVNAPIADRITMCRLGCAEELGLTVSDIEANRAGMSYSIDTIRRLKSDHPDASFVFLIGSDAAASLPAWHEADELARLIPFAVLERPGALDEIEPLLAQLRTAGFSVKVVPAPLVDISSTQVREMLERKESVRELVPEPVAHYIESHGLYRPQGKKTDDIFSDAFYETCHRELESRVSAKRLAHIEGVAQTAAELARRFGVDERKARLAGLLHDWDKGFDDEGIRARVYELGLEEELDPAVVEHMPQVLHGPTAARALERAFPQIPQDVIRAIRNHTTASVDADDLEKVLYIADAIEPTRTFPDAAYLRAQAADASLDDLFFEVYRFWTMALVERGRTLHPDTVAIWNAVVAARDARLVQEHPKGEGKRNRRNRHEKRNKHDRHDKRSKRTHSNDVCEERQSKKKRKKGH